MRYSFPRCFRRVFDIASYPLVLSHFTLGMDINTLGKIIGLDIPAVGWFIIIIMKMLPDVQTIEGKSLNLSVSGRTILLR